MTWSLVLLRIPEAVYAVSRLSEKNMGKAMGAAKGRSAAGQKSGRVVKSVDRAPSGKKSKAGKQYKSTRIGGK
jgi:hypothetical protein